MTIRSPSKTKRAALRELRRLRHEQNRESRKQRGKFREELYVSLSKARALAKLRVNNYKCPLPATAIRSDLNGSFPVNLDMSGFRWIKTHSETFRRAKPKRIAPGYYTAIAAGRQWSLPLRGTYINSSDKVRITGALEPCCSVNPLQQVGLLTVFNSIYGNGAYPVSNVELMSIVGNNVLKQVQDRKLDLTVALGEGPETFQFLRQTVKEVNSLVESIGSKTGNPGRRFEHVARRHPKNRESMKTFSRRKFNETAPDKRWLEYNFAIVPLADDAQGAAESIAALAPDLRELYASSSARSVTGVSFPATAGAIQDGYYILYSGEVHTRFVQRVDYVVSDATLKRLAELGFTNPASYLYQRTPLSFVADWVIPVGDFLDLWTAPLGCDLVAAYAATYMHCELDKSFQKQATWKKVSLSSDSAKWYYRGYIRRNTFVFPYPSLYVKNPLSSWTAITSAALLKQRSK